MMIIVMLYVEWSGVGVDARESGRAIASARKHDQTSGIYFFNMKIGSINRLIHHLPFR
jgi:hypothetical protein